MVVFIHGWKHSAAPGDANIETFRKALANLSAADASVSRRSGRSPRRIVGVYLGWRGGSVSVPGIKELTFWERKNTAHKVGHGGVTEVLSRLELIKQTKNHMEGSTDTRLVVVGHSFGGAVAYAALGQILANRFVHTTGPVGVQSTVTGYGDLVVLINHAFEAMLFASLSDMSFERGSYFQEQLPVVAVLTSEADDATRLAFPLGRRLSTLFENDHDMMRLNATTKATETIDGGSANVTAIGHFGPYRTHTLVPSDSRSRAEVAPAEPEQAASVFAQTSSGWAEDKPGSEIAFGGLTLKRTDTSAGRNPYLVAYVNKEIINDHNDIDDPRLIQFIEQLILISTQPTQSMEKVDR
jgi:pimeloyl-ACP methyl ester carboxylesterase